MTRKLKRFSKWIKKRILKSCITGQPSVVAPSGISEKAEDPPALADVEIARNNQRKATTYIAYIGHVDPLTAKPSRVFSERTGIGKVSKESIQQRLEIAEQNRKTSLQALRERLHARIRFAEAARKRRSMVSVRSLTHGHSLLEEVSFYSFSTSTIDNAHKSLSYVIYSSSSTIYTPPSFHVEQEMRRGLVQKAKLLIQKMSSSITPSNRENRDPIILYYQRHPPAPAGIAFDLISKRQKSVKLPKSLRTTKMIHEKAQDNAIKEKMIRASKNRREFLDKRQQKLKERHLKVEKLRQRKVLQMRAPRLMGPKKTAGALSFTPAPAAGSTICTILDISDDCLTERKMSVETTGQGEFPNTSLQFDAVAHASTHKASLIRKPIAEFTDVSPCTSSYVPNTENEAENSSKGKYSTLFLEKGMARGTGQLRVKLPKLHPQHGYKDSPITNKESHRGNQIRMQFLSKFKREEERDITSHVEQEEEVEKEMTPTHTLDQLLDKYTTKGTPCNTWAASKGAHCVTGATPCTSTGLSIRSNDSLIKSYLDRKASSMLSNEGDFTSKKLSNHSTCSYNYTSDFESYVSSKNNLALSDGRTSTSYNYTSDFEAYVSSKAGSALSDGRTSTLYNYSSDFEPISSRAGSDGEKATLCNYSSDESYTNSNACSAGLSNLYNYSSHFESDASSEANSRLSNRRSSTLCDYSLDFESLASSNAGSRLSQGGSSAMPLLACSSLNFESYMNSARNVGSSNSISSSALNKLSNSTFLYNYSSDFESDTSIKVNTSRNSSTNSDYSLGCGMNNTNDSSRTDSTSLGPRNHSSASSYYNYTSDFEPESQSTSTGDSSFRLRRMFSNRTSMDNYSTSMESPSVSTVSSGGHGCKLTPSKLCVRNSDISIGQGEQAATQWKVGESFRTYQHVTHPLHLSVTKGGTGEGKQCNNKGSTHESSSSRHDSSAEEITEDGSSHRVGDKLIPLGRNEESQAKSNRYTLSPDGLGRRRKSVSCPIGLPSINNSLNSEEIKVCSKTSGAHGGLPSIVSAVDQPVRRGTPFPIESGSAPRSARKRSEAQRCALLPPSVHVQREMPGSSATSAQHEASSSDSKFSKERKAIKESAPMFPPINKGPSVAQKMEPLASGSRHGREKTDDAF